MDLSSWPERFSSKINIGKADECWLWRGVLSTGYGQFWLNGKMRGAHCCAMSFLFGPIPGNKVVMHSCDNRRCCNPHHLSVVSQAENIHDAHVKGLAPKGSTHGMAILNETEVLYVRERRETASKAAKLLGVSRGTINDIRQRKSWRHI